MAGKKWGEATEEEKRKDLIKRLSLSLVPKIDHIVSQLTHNELLWNDRRLVKRLRALSNLIEKKLRRLTRLGMRY